MGLRARIVLAAAGGEENLRIAERLGVAPNTVVKWRKRFFEEGMDASPTESARADPGAFPPLAVAELKELACELPATTGVPLSRWSCSELARELVLRAVVATISAATVWRVLHDDAIRPWFHRSWIFPRDPDFAAKSAVALDLYARVFEGEALGPSEFVVCADEKTSIQARCLEHQEQRLGSRPPQPGEQEGVQQLDPQLGLEGGGERGVRELGPRRGPSSGKWVTRSGSTAASAAPRRSLSSRAGSDRSTSSSDHQTSRQPR